MTDRISVLLVDDHALVRRGFKRLLEDDPGIAVVGEASDGEAAIRLTMALRPRVVIMDCALPDRSGLIVTRRILKECPQTAVLFVSVHGEETVIRQAFEAGARGYVLKAAIDFDLGGAVRQVAMGETVLDVKLARAAIGGGAVTHGLSERQREILQLVCDGLSNEAIGGALGVSVNTVRAHRARIMKTLGLRRAAELVTYALRHRLVNRF